MGLEAWLTRPFRILASLKTAIPLLVVTVVATIAGSLQPDTNYYRSNWYLLLLGLNGLSLLFVTVQHIPAILAKKGRNALIGVVATHLGILVLIAGAIYGGVAGERYTLRVIEGEMTVVPGLPFVVHLDQPPGLTRHRNRVPSGAEDHSVEDAEHVKDEGRRMKDESGGTEAKG